jgi:hypothetical protein
MSVGFIVGVLAVLRRQISVRAESIRHAVCTYIRGLYAMHLVRPWCSATSLLGLWAQIQVALVDVYSAVYVNCDAGFER